MTPSPCCYRLSKVLATKSKSDFEEIQEDMIQSPDSLQLTEYEEYCRQELPKLVRVFLEEIVHKSIVPLEEDIKSRLVEIIRDALDQISISYRQSRTIVTPIQSNIVSGPEIVPPEVLLQKPTISGGTHSSTENFEGTRKSQAPIFFQAPPPQAHPALGWNLPVQDLPSRKAGENDQSDSGYGDGQDIPPLLTSESTANPFTPSSEAPTYLESDERRATHAEKQNNQFHPVSGGSMEKGLPQGERNDFLPPHYNFDSDFSVINSAAYDTSSFHNFFFDV